MCHYRHPWIFMLYTVYNIKKLFKNFARSVIIKLDLTRKISALKDFHQHTSIRVLIILVFDLDATIPTDCKQIYLEQIRANLKAIAALMWWTYDCIQFERKSSTLFIPWILNLEFFWIDTLSSLIVER